MLVKSKHTKLDTDYIIFFQMGATMASCEVLWMLSVALEKKTVTMTIMFTLRKHLAVKCTIP